MNSEIRDCLGPDRNPRTPDIALPSGSIDTHVHVFDFKCPFTPDRGYTPPESTLADLTHLHSTLGIDRVVFTQPSVYGTDNSLMMDSVADLNRKKPDSARAVVSCTADVTDQELEEFESQGARGLRFNMDNAGGTSVTVDQLPDLAARIAPLGWHMEFLFPGDDLLELLPTFEKLTVPVSIAHFAYQPAPAGVSSPGFQALLGLVRDGNTWIKVSGADRVSGIGKPRYDDVTPLAHALIEANEDRIVWGSDWPHPNKFEDVPDDAGLVETLGGWIPDETLRRKILVDNAAAFYRF